MTSTTAFPLLAPVLDDSMEVSSSPAGNHYDDEVLIDYDDDYGTSAFIEDEHMIEDGEPTRPGTATDDMMEDAEPSAPVNEEIMHDDPVTVAPDTFIEDEELIDYSDEDYQEDTQVTLDDTAVQTAEVAESSSHVPIETVIEPKNEDEHVDEPSLQQSEDAAVVVEESTASFLPAVEQNHELDASTEDEVAAATVVEPDEQAEHVQQDKAADELSRQIDSEGAAAQELGDQAFEADESEDRSGPAGDTQVHDEAMGLKYPPKFPAGLDTTAYFAPDGPQTPSDTGIHPVTVRYGDVVMPLFKSRAQPDGLLKDDNLASVSLGDLLDSCRHRLAVKIGESVSTDQELVLSFENMGLQVIEHSPHAFETSLDDVLEVYLRLHRNDSTQTIPPLALSLSLQLKFTSSFNILKAAAQQGDGMSKFAYLRSGPDELDEYEEEEEEGETGHEEYQNNEAAGEEQHYEGDTFAEDQEDGEVPHLEGQEYEEDQHQESFEGNQEYDAGQSHEGQQDEISEEEHDQQHQTNSNDGLAHDSDDGEPLVETADAQDGVEGAEEASQPEANHAVEETAQESEEPVRPESTASSTTVRGELTNDATELHVDDENDDFSALVSEYDAEEAAVDATATDHAHEHEFADATVDAHARESHLEDNLAQQTVEELDGEQAEEDTAATETRDEAGIDAAQHGQDEIPPADNLDLNEFDLPEDDLPEDELTGVDEQFDLLEGHDFGNGTENDEPTKATDGLEFDNDDDIGFNDDLEEAVLASHSPSGKRSFDDHVGKNDVAEVQRSKRARS